MSNRYPLGFFPTPVHKLNNLSRVYQPYEIYIKRDDQTGLASGGNKTRKLEYLLQEAFDQECDTIVTAGAQQSNHARQTAAACAIAGLECHLLLKGEAPGQPNGNLLLSLILGAKVHYAGEKIRDEQVEQLMKDLFLLGKKPYFIPIGGSNPTGALGFVEACRELKQQLQQQDLKMDYIFFASCSGGTQAGLLLGKEKYGLEGTLMPVSIQKPELDETPLELLVLDIVNLAKPVTGIERVFLAEDLALIRGYDEAGYGVVTPQEKKAIHELARSEGIFLDPVYTGRAFFAMMDYLQKGLPEPGSKILFWHTGGLPAIFAYADKIQ